MEQPNIAPVTRSMYRHRREFATSTHRQLPCREVRRVDLPKSQDPNQPKELISIIRDYHEQLTDHLRDRVLVKPHVKSGEEMDRELKTECEEQSRPYQSIYSHFGPVAHCSRHQIGSLYNFLITVGTSDGMTDLKWKTFQEVFSDNPTTIQGYLRQNGLIQDPYF